MGCASSKGATEAVVGGGPAAKQSVVGGKKTKKPPVEGATTAASCPNTKPASECPNSECKFGVCHSLRERRDGGGGAGSGRDSDTSSHDDGLAVEDDDADNPELHNFPSKMIRLEDSTVKGHQCIEDVYEGVNDGSVLGAGMSGVVRRVRHCATGVEYAVKCINLTKIESEEAIGQLREEISIMSQLDHPNIVRLEEVYETADCIYLVQELCRGGDLMDRLDLQPDYHYSEAQCAKLVKQMLSAIRYIHSKGILHRDLKLENFLLESDAPDSELKLIDFGLAKHFKRGVLEKAAVGTPYTVAPEVIHGSYDERCDVWSLGVIAYMLLSGDPPFGGVLTSKSQLSVATMLQLKSRILLGQFDFLPAYIWQGVSQEARTFIRSLLVRDPKQRPTSEAVASLPWLVEWSERECSQENASKLNPNVVRNLMEFRHYSALRKLFYEVLSFTILPEQLTELRHEFEKIDREGTGEISLADLQRVLLANAGAGTLGGLSEQDVLGIFNAMRMEESETKIRWHEFIAANLTNTAGAGGAVCRMDDRNLKLAFERLDADHNGYITLDNVRAMLGGYGIQEEELRKLWGEACPSKTRLDFDEFKQLVFHIHKHKNSTR